MKSKHLIYSVASFASIILLVQIIPVANAAGSQTRKDLEDEKKKTDEELSKLKSSLNVARQALKDAKEATDIARENYYKDTSDESLLKIWQDAREKEAQARFDYNKTLEAVRDFKPKKETKAEIEVDKVETDFVDEKQLQDPKIPAPQKKPLTLAKEKLRDALNAWKETTKNVVVAAKAWKNDPTDDNMSTLQQALQVAEDAIKKIADAKDDVKQLQQS